MVAFTVISRTLSLQALTLPLALTVDHCYCFIVLIVYVKNYCTYTRNCIHVKGNFNDNIWRFSHAGVAFGRTTTQTTHGQGNGGGGSSVPQQFQGRPASSKYLVRQRRTEHVVHVVSCSWCGNHGSRCNAEPLGDNTIKVHHTARQQEPKPH